MAATMKTICAYCPGFDRFDPINNSGTHGICDACFKKFMQAIEVKEQAKRLKEGR